MLSGGGTVRWVKNLRANPSVTVGIAGDIFEAQARVIETSEEDGSPPPPREKHEAPPAAWPTGGEALSVAVDLNAQADG